MNVLACLINLWLRRGFRLGLRQELHGMRRYAAFDGNRRVGLRQHGKVSRADGAGLLTSVAHVPKGETARGPADEVGVSSRKGCGARNQPATLAARRKATKGLHVVFTLVT
jgi:hypothetical protein